MCLLHCSKIIIVVMCLKQNCWSNITFTIIVKLSLGGIYAISSKLVSVTLMILQTSLVNTTPSILQHILRDQTFQFKTPSFIRLRHSIMRSSESLFCHITEVLNAKFFFPLCYIHLKYIHFHLGTTWELHLPLGTS